MSFAATLEAMRDARKLTQGDVSRASGLERSFITRLEDGTRQPSRATVMALAAALCLSDAETDELRQAAGYSARYDPDVERFRKLPPDVRRAVLDLIEKARVA